MTRTLQTADYLLYSSMYDSLRECRYIHDEWIVRRALAMAKHPRIMYLPMSNDEAHGQSQQYSSGAFLDYFRQYEHLGLRSFAYCWRETFSKGELDAFFLQLTSCEVIILGGGTSDIGLERYARLGELGYKEPNRFRAVLQERQAQRKMTVGFSAGAEQLCTSLMASIEYEDDPRPGLGLVKDIIVAVHYDDSRKQVLQAASRLFPQCLIVALPNETGLGICQRKLPNDKIWQIIEFIVDPSARAASHITCLRPGGTIHHLGNGVGLTRYIDPKTLTQEIRLQAANTAWRGH
jgi:hypothetical protein